MPRLPAPTDDEAVAILAAYEPFPTLPQETYWVFMVVAALGTVLAAGYLLWLYQRTSFGVPSEEFEKERIRDVLPTEWLAWVPMLVLILVLGIYPRLLFDPIDEPSQKIEAQVCLGYEESTGESAGCDIDDFAGLLD